MTPIRKAALLILDGWGQRAAAKDNAVVLAGTPRLSALMDKNPHTTLGACGLEVGLPDGQMGNSEVGHLNLGAGRIVYQDLTRINRAIADGSFGRNPVLVEACDRVVGTGGALHLMGLVSDGGVHSHQEHLYALLRLAKARGVTRVFVHAFLDGRDTPPRSGAGYVAALEEVFRREGVGRLVTLMGRYYAMDRDTRWERVQRAYRAMVHGEGIPVASGRDGAESAYREGQSDEFVEPRVVRDGTGRPVATVGDGDALVFFNYRADRAREITRAFTEDAFQGFPVAGRPQLTRFVAFTDYDETFRVPVAFPPERLRNIFSEVVSKAGCRQLRIAETEKYAHVTFFFNGGEEAPFPGEERVLIPSPRDVTTYDRKPEMSAYLVRDRLLAEIRSGRHDVIVANFANLDMVGHTGILEAAEKAVRVVDGCVGEVAGLLAEHGYATVITADHGNAEEMWSEASGQPHTAHTKNRVPCVLVDPRHRGARLRTDGILADVAPTLLGLMGLAVPSEMTGRSLL